MVVRFWGTRGSIAKAGPTTVRYGGNTSCVEVRSASGTLVVLDCGTGAHNLGQVLSGAEPGVTAGHILLTHTHWDHIQGLPFFQPLFAPDDNWTVLGPRGFGPSLREALAGQMQYTYFPVSLGQLGNRVRYYDLEESTFLIGDIRVTARYLNHTALTLGYRLEVDGVTLVYATDHEPHSRQLATGRGELTGEDRKHAEFVAGADLLIHDSQYLASEYPAKVNWGHSTVEYVLAIAQSAGVRQLALYHHDPLRDDAAIDGIVCSARAQLAEAASPLTVCAAAEGAIITLERARVAPREVSPEPAALAGGPSGIPSRPVLVSVQDPGLRGKLVDAVRASECQLLVADDAMAVRQLLRSAAPALLLLDRTSRQYDGIEFCQELRDSGERYSREVPVVLVADKETADDCRLGQAAGVTDWLIAPFGLAYARARLAAWLIRSKCHWARAPLPVDEDARLQALGALGVLDTQPEERFDRITRLAAALFNVPIALVSLLEHDRQWFKSCVGTELRETSREMSFCAHAILQDAPLIVPDALLDPRFADNPLVTGPSRVRFYAGVPLSVQHHYHVGTLCIVDRRPRDLDESALRLLKDLGALAEAELARSSLA